MSERLEMRRFWINWHYQEEAYADDGPYCWYEEVEHLGRNFAPQASVPVDVERAIRYGLDMIVSQTPNALRDGYPVDVGAALDWLNLLDSQRPQGQEDSDGNA